jgi:hypothetical protein
MLTQVVQIISLAPNNSFKPSPHLYGHERTVNRAGRLKQALGAMPPFLDLRMSDSASSQIEAMLSDKEEGSVPLLLMPVVGLERRRIVEIRFYPPAVLEEMRGVCCLGRKPSPRLPREDRGNL